MGNLFLIRQSREIGAAQTVTTTGDKVTFTPSQPIQVVRWGLVAVAAITSGANFVSALDHRPTAGSDTGRTEKSTVSTTTNVAAGKGLYNDLSAPVTVLPGEQLVVEVTTAASGGTTAAQYFIEYFELPFVGTNVANMTKKAA